MASYTDLLPLVRRHVAGCPDFVILDALKYAAREFCRDSWFLRRAIFVEMVDGQSHYALTPNEFVVTPDEESDRDSLEIIGVISVQIEGGQPLDPLSPDQVCQRPGTPCHFITYPPATVELSPYPEANAAGKKVRVWAAAQPTLASTWLSEDLAREFDHALANGAVSRITEVEGAAWSSPQLSAKHGQLFHAEKMDAKGKALRAQMPRGLRIMPVRYA